MWFFYAKMHNLSFHSSFGASEGCFEGEGTFHSHNWIISMAVWHICRAPLSPFIFGMPKRTWHATKIKSWPQFQLWLKDFCNVTAKCHLCSFLLKWATSLWAANSISMLELLLSHVFSLVQGGIISLSISKYINTLENCYTFIHLVVFPF